MMKKLPLLALLLGLALTLTACTDPDIAGYYQSAQLYLGAGDYDYAAELFSQLGEYEDSADYALYAAALQAIEDEEYALARANLEAIAPFKSSERFLTWLDAAQAEEDGELEEALRLYEQLGSFRDAHLEAERLNKAIPEAAVKEGRALMTKGDYAAARDIFLGLDGYGASKALADNCTLALQKAEYADAEEKRDAGDLLGAMEAFLAMGDALDAAEQAQSCLAAIHAGLDEQYKAVTLATAPELLKAYETLGEDKTALARIAELNARFGRNLEVITKQEARVLLGSYPYAQSGEEHAVLWRVLKAEGSTLTLLSEAVLDASDEANPIALTLNETEMAAAGEALLPSMADLAGLTDLTCAATAYAKAQGAQQEGMPLYWLRDALESGLHPVIGANGALALPIPGVTAGIRPIITLDLDKITFTAGSGTMEDPFRAE